MQLGRVTGTVVATEKVQGLAGVKFLIVQPLDKRQNPAGAPLVAADAVHMAGPGSGSRSHAGSLRPGGAIVNVHAPASRDGRVLVSTINAPFDGRTLLYAICRGRR